MTTESKDWSPRYLAYVKDEGFQDPDAMLAHDRERYPVGYKMSGFILWINDRWNEWARLTGHPRAKDANAPFWPKDHVAFDAWLGATSVSPPKVRSGPCRRRRCSAP